MNFLHFILLVLLGLLTSSMAAVPRQVVNRGIIIDSVIDKNYDVDVTPDKELLDHGILPRDDTGLVRRYELKCTKDRSVAPPKGFMPGRLLSDKFCQGWWDCKSDGTKFQSKSVPKAWDQNGGQSGRSARSKVAWCKDNCECEEVDQPEEHTAYNMGCVNPYGAVINGMYGSVARDTDSAGPPDDGLAMEAFDGPPRKQRASRAKLTL